MKRIKIPRCSVCDAVAQYESNRWPALLLCHPCHLKFMTYLNDKMADLIPDNPLVESLAVEDGFVWVQVDSSTRSEERRVGKECAVRVDLGGRRIIKKKNTNRLITRIYTKTKIIAYLR